VVGATRPKGAGGGNPAPPARTRAAITRLIFTSVDAAANALLALFRAGVAFKPGDEILTGLCAQIIDRKAERAAGTLRPGYGLLSPRQLEVWRVRAHKYGAELVAIAAAKAESRAPLYPGGEPLDLDEELARA